MDKVKRAKMHAARRCRLRRVLPRLREFCAGAGVAMKRTGDRAGWDFRHGEYILLWYPTTNVVTIQTTLPGSGTVRFEEPGRPDRPRILMALERICLVRRKVTCG